MADKPQNKAVIAVGDPFSGIKLLGPFDNDAEAMDWADGHLEDCEWWTVEIRPIDR